MQTDQANIRPLAASSEHVEAVLAAESQRLQDLIRVLDDDIEHPGASRDEGRDKTCGLERRMFERDLLERCEIELCEVYLAMGRLHQGTYGLCEGCGQPIGIERLAAIPATTLCVACPAGRRDPARLKASHNPGRPDRR